MDVVFHFFKKVISLAVFMCFLIGFFLKLQQFALRKEIPEIFASRIWNPGILSGEIWNSAQGIQNPTNDWNPESKFHWQTIRDPFTFLGNCPPTPPLSQHFALSKNYMLMLV